MLLLGIFIAFLAVIVPLAIWFFTVDVLKGNSDESIPAIRIRGWLGSAAAIRFMWNPYETFTRLVLQNGIIRLPLLGHTFVCFSDPVHIEQVLTSPYCGDKPEVGYDNIRSVLGQQSLVTSNGERWRIQRRLASKVFQSHNMQNFVQVFVECARTLVDVLKV